MVEFIFNYYNRTMSTKIINLSITGMHCESCGTGIQMVTEGMEGVIRAAVSFEKKNGEWEIDDEKTSKESIVKEIESLGYEIGN